MRFVFLLALLIASPAFADSSTPLLAAKAKAPTPIITEKPVITNTPTPAGSGSPIASTGNNDIITDILAQNGTCNDSSGNGNACIISGSPTYVASLASANNQPAWTLDGTTANYFIVNDGRTTSGLGQGYFGGGKYAFTAPTGDWGALIVVDLNASMDGVSFYPLIAGSVTGTSSYFFGFYNRQLYWTSSTCTLQKQWTTIGAVSTTGPHVISFAWSAALQKVSACVDGCAGGWVDQTYAGSTQTGNYSAASTDGTMMIGGTPVTPICGTVVKPYFGHLLEWTLYKESPATSGKATLWAARRDALRTKYGTP